MRLTMIPLVLAITFLVPISHLAHADDYPLLVLIKDGGASGTNYGLGVQTIAGGYYPVTQIKDFDGSPVELELGEDGTELGIASDGGMGDPHRLLRRTRDFHWHAGSRYIAPVSVSYFASHRLIPDEAGFELILGVSEAQKNTAMMMGDQRRALRERINRGEGLLVRIRRIGGDLPRFAFYIDDQFLPVRQVVAPQPDGRVFDPLAGDLTPFLGFGVQPVDLRRRGFPGIEAMEVILGWTPLADLDPADGLAFAVPLTSSFSEPVGDGDLLEDRVRFQRSPYKLVVHGPDGGLNNVSWVTFNGGDARVGVGPGGIGFGIYASGTQIALSSPRTLESGGLPKLDFQASHALSFDEGERTLEIREVLGKPETPLNLASWIRDGELKLPLYALKLEGRNYRCCFVFVDGHFHEILTIGGSEGHLQTQYAPRSKVLFHQAFGMIGFSIPTDLEPELPEGVQQAIPIRLDSRFRVTGEGRALTLHWHPGVPLDLAAARGSRGSDASEPSAGSPGGAATRDIVDAARAIYGSRRQGWPGEFCQSALQLNEALRRRTEAP